ncbi:MAG: S1 RNA-binding domain-containing protein [Chloroflexi bacterium]|jgi:signal transduction histidine kinase/DNA-binding response OmpR family regulator/predicted RNA-binding protein with RPS1 domain|nr:S1 RNA-binding domain-containing protein [Chloroflexota bacterium]
MVSIARTRQRYSEGQRVTATVEKVLPFGVFVRLADGTRAYIRRRELSLEGDRPPGEIVSEGQTLQAVVLSPAEAGRLMELTVRAIHPDPWEQFVRRYKVRDTVTATVKHVVPNGVFVQIIPGVNGFIPLEELVSWRVEKAEDVVWTGDEVEAVITRIDPSRKKVNLSIRQRMEQLARVESVFRQIGFTEGVPDSIAAELIGESASSQEEAAEFVGRIGPILVLDDHDSIRDPLVQWLIRQGYTACGAKTVPEALTLCQAQPYGLILVDLDLPQIDGLQFIRQIRDCGERTFIAVMSSPEWIDEHFLEIQQLGVSEMFPKPVNEQKLRQFLLRLDRGEIIEPRIDLRESSLPEIRTAQQLSAVMRSRIPLARRFHNGLEYLLEMTRAEEAIVFHMDRTSRIVSIVASVGSIPLNEFATYALVTSPVKDVILEGETIWENRVSQEPTRRFEKLLELLPFESCIGIPIEASGQTEYALFLFHREPETFSRYRLRDAWAMATLFAVAIEQDALDRRIQEISRTFLSGHLAAGLGHEIYNRLSGLDLEFQNLIADFEALWRNSPELRMPAAEEIRRALGRAAETAGGLKQLVGEFRLLLKAMQEEQVVDVNEVVRQSASLIEPQARRTKVTLRFLPSPDVLPVAGSGVGLQHVLLNLMLNAIQHMALKPDERRVLEISTAWEDDALPVKIRVSDTGPGIHRQLWEKIFALGFTTKPGGSGLGLYIARSLVEAMGGRISVERSLVPLGTTFLVELPAASRK